MTVVQCDKCGKIGCEDNCILSKKKCAFYWQESDYYGEVDEGCYLCSKNCHTKILCYLPYFMQKIILEIMKSITFQMKESFKRIFHPFKYGFWTIVNIKKFKLGMLWEEWDSYAGDGDYGFISAYTGNRKTTKQMKRDYYDSIFRFDEFDGLVFCLPYFISFILLFIPTLIYEHKCQKSMEKQIEFFNTHYFDDEKGEFVEKGDKK